MICSRVQYGRLYLYQPDIADLFLDQMLRNEKLLIIKTLLPKTINCSLLITINFK